MLAIQRLASATVASVAAGRNLNAVLTELTQRHPLLTKHERAAITDASYGTLRYGMRLDIVLRALLNQPLRDDQLRWLLLVALYQLNHTRAAPHAVVDHAVRCARQLGSPSAAGLINAVLRNFLRRRTALLAQAAAIDVGRYAYPQWWIEKLRQQMPQHYEAVLEAGNAHPPFIVRVNKRRMSRDEYLQVLAEAALPAHAVDEFGVYYTRAVPVDILPGFSAGVVSVQDSAAQRAAPLLDVHDGQRVLDLCAAPGGKTGHLLELADVELTAVDSDASRLARVQQNLDRLELRARLLVGDATQVSTWWDGKPYDRILADVPCSASGVVRRHPDIKWLRRRDDIAKFATQQQRILESAWGVLASGGKLLYTTCSIFHEENAQQVTQFLASHADARLVPVHGLNAAHGMSPGLLLPDDEHDGFFYALLQKL